MDLRDMIPQNQMAKFVEYLKETKGELKHVNWPTKKETMYYTLLVIVLSIVIGYYLGVFDFIFAQALQKILPI
jgi:preprotein translocase subunit SecE